MPTPEQLARYADGFNATKTLAFFGVKLSFPSPDRVRATLEVREDHLGGLGTDAVNGGILAALFDLVVGSSGALVDPERRSATVQLSLQFQKPVRGPVIHAEAWVDSAGRSTVFSSAHIVDGSGAVCARATGVLRLSNRPWEGGGHPGVN